MKAQPEYIVQFVSHRNELAVLTSHGRMFEHIPDPRGFNTTPNKGTPYIWVEIKLPELRPAE
jgi:hypothetical protein